MDRMLLYYELRNGILLVSERSFLLREELCALTRKSDLKKANSAEQPDPSPNLGTSVGTRHHR